MTSKILVSVRTMYDLFWGELIPIPLTYDEVVPIPLTCKILVPIPLSNE